jgi:hypothetical protein
MTKSKIFFGATVLALMSATALLLLHMRANQRLGEPGVKTRPLAGEPAGSRRLEILMPEATPGYTSEISTNGEAVVSHLPPDTSIRVRMYQAEDKFFVQYTTVLMGSDRSSIHKPQICMTGQGWQLDATHSTVETIHLDRPQPYELPVNKLVAGKYFAGADGKPELVRGIYIYWFVDATHLTATANQWMLWWMPRDLLLNGVLERWAYISVFSACPPGQEAATYERMKKFIAATVPEFQLVPKADR